MAKDPYLLESRAFSHPARFREVEFATRGHIVKKFDGGYPDPVLGGGYPIKIDP